MNFLAPFGLLLGVLAVPLAALYFLKIRRQRIVVPSLLLWEELAKVERLATPFERFRRNLLFFLQLLALLLFTLALARPSIPTDRPPGTSLILVLDTSASMGTLDGAPTRLDLAIEQAVTMVNGLESSGEAMLIVAGPETEVRVPFSRNHGQLIHEIRVLKPTEATGNLREGVLLALSVAHSRPGVGVAIFSDGGGASLSDLTVGEVAVQFVPIGRSDKNLGIVGMDVRRSPVSDRERQVFVTLEQFGSSTATVTLELKIENRSLGMRTETIEPGIPLSVVFDLPAGLEGVLEATLEAENDLLMADNRAFAILAANQDRQILLVGADRLTAKAISSDPRFETDIVGIDALNRELASRYDAVVVRGDVPNSFEGISYLQLSPDSGSGVQFGSRVDGPKVISWRRTHPTMRFIEWDGVAISRAKVVTDTAGLLPIVESDAGALVLAGDRKGARQMVLAFDPLESDLPLRIAYPVLLLNSLDWLTDRADTEMNGLLAAGTPYLRPITEDISQIRVTGPGGELPPSLVNGMLRVKDTFRVGVYQIEAKDWVSSFAVNLLSPTESRIAPRTLDLPSSEASSAKATLTGYREIWRELLFGLLALIIVEWWLYHRRRTA